MSDGKLEGEMDIRIGALSAVMRVLLQSVVVKKELSRKAKLSIYFFPTLTYDHKLWAVTKRMKSRMQAAEIDFCRRVAGSALDRVSTLTVRREL